MANFTFYHGNFLLYWHGKIEFFLYMTNLPLLTWQIYLYHHGKLFTFIAMAFFVGTNLVI